MAVRRDDTQINKEVSTLNTTYSAGTLKFYTGTQPASGNDAATGTLLCTITLPGTPFSITGKVATKANTWSGTATAGGTVGWARMEGLDNANIDFSVTVTSGGGDIEVDDTTFVNGGTVTVTGGTITYN